MHDQHPFCLGPSRRLPLLGVPLLLGLVWIAGCGGQDGKPQGRETGENTVPITSISISPDGRTIACCKRDRTVTLLDRGTLKTVRTLRFGNRVPMVARFQPRGEILLVAYYDGSVALWNVKTAAAEPIILGTHDSDVRSAEFAHDGRTVITGDGGGEIILWNVAERGNGYRVHRHQSAVWCVAFSQDDRRFMSGGSDGMIRVWDSATGRQLRVLSGHTAPVRSLAAGADDTLVSGSLDSTIRCWNVVDGRELWKVRSPGNGVISTVLSRDGTTIASSTVFSGDIELWNANTRKLTSTIAAHEVMTSDLAFMPDGRLVSSGMDGDIQTWLVPNENRRNVSPRPPAVSLNLPARSTPVSRLAVE